MAQIVSHLLMSGEISKDQPDKEARTFSSKSWCYISSLKSSNLIGPRLNKRGWLKSYNWLLITRFKMARLQEWDQKSTIYHIIHSLNKLLYLIIGKTSTFPLTDSEKTYLFIKEEFPTNRITIIKHEYRWNFSLFYTTRDKIIYILLRTPLKNSTHFVSQKKNV